MFRKYFAEMLYVCLNVDIVLSLLEIDFSSQCIICLLRQTEDLLRNFYKLLLRVFNARVLLRLLL